MVYLETDGTNAVRVIANGDDYWEVGHAFLAHDIEVSQISLLASVATQVRVYLGGT